jgi:hypothetical protein
MSFGLVPGGGYAPPKDDAGLNSEDNTQRRVPCR